MMGSTTGMNPPPFSISTMKRRGAVWKGSGRSSRCSSGTSYVPMADNAVFSRLMDAGKLLFGRITGKQMQGS